MSKNAVLSEKMSGLEVKNGWSPRGTLWPVRKKSSSLWKGMCT